MNIKGKIVTLRAIEREDLAALQKWANSTETQYLLGGWHFPTNMEDQTQWHARVSAQSLDQRFAVDAPDHGLIGTANLVDINWKDRNAFHGMMLGEELFRGKGYGTDTIMAVARYSFEELGLRRLDTTIIEYNEVSLNVYLRKCGWKEEGRQRGWYYRKGRFWDRVCLGLTVDDYSELLRTTKYWDLQD